MRSVVTFLYAYCWLSIGNGCTLVNSRLLSGRTFMNKVINKFGVKTDNKIVQAVGNSYIMQPKVRFNGGTVKWYEDTYKKDKKTYEKKI